MALDVLRFCALSLPENRVPLFRNMREIWSLSRLPFGAPEPTLVRQPRRDLLPLRFGARIGSLAGLTGWGNPSPSNHKSGAAAMHSSPDRRGVLHIGFCPRRAASLASLAWPSSAGCDRALTQWCRRGGRLVRCDFWCRFELK